MKIHGYTTDLIVLYNENVSIPFQWGTFDCCIWSARVIDRITGRNVSILDGWDFDYTTKIEAFAYLSTQGYESLEALADYYFTRVDNRKAMRGDLVLANNFLTVHYGSELVGVGVGGLVKLPLTTASIAWSVG